MRESDDHEHITAEAAGGMIRVSLRDDGLIDSIDLNPRVKRISVEALAGGILEAVATAQKELIRRSEAAAAPPAPPPEKVLEEKLDGIYSEYLRQTAEFQRIGIELLKRMKD